MKQIYIIRHVGTETSFRIITTMNGASNIISILSIETESIWTFTTEKEEMKKYNGLMESEDYIRQLSQYQETYKGLNLTLAIRAFHKRLNIFPMPKSFKLFQKFEV